MQQDDNIEEFYTITEIARRLKVSEDTIRRLVNKGELKALRVGRQLRITRESLEEYIRQSSS